MIVGKSALGTPSSAISHKLSFSLIEAVMPSFDPKKLLWATMLAGAFLRTYQYISNRSLWYDEAMLALNILRRPYLELLQPLDSDQVAPIGFLFAEKLVVQTMGGSEYALRLVPLLSGIASLYLFYKVAAHLLGQRARLVAVGLFSFSYRLIYYSSEVKPYIVDVLFLLVLYLVTIPIVRTRLTFSRGALFIVASVLAVWFSLTAIFVFAGMSLCIVADGIHKRRARGLVPALVLIAPPTLSFVVMYSVMRTAGSSQYLLDYWAYAFLPFPPTSMEAVRQIDNTFLRFFQNPVGLFPSSVAAMCLVIGAIATGVRHRMNFLLLSSPAFFALLASALHLYPFGGRLVLFLVPVVLILVAVGALSFNAGSARLPAVNAGLAAILVVPAVLYSSSIVFRPLADSDEDIKTILGHVQEHWRDGDILYVHHESAPAFAYYAQRYKFHVDDYYTGQVTGGSRQLALRDEMDRLDGYARVWLLFSHIRRSGFEEDVYLASYLDGKRTRLESFTSNGAVVYLYKSR
jgi:hypothetical protein